MAAVFLFGETQLLKADVRLYQLNLRNQTCADMVEFASVVTTKNA